MNEVPKFFEKKFVFINCDSQRFLKLILRDI